MIKANKFYFAYAGSKRNEFSKIVPLILEKKDEIKTIVEPFGGSVAISRKLYEMFPSHFSFEFSDIDEKLVNFCNNFWKNGEEILKEAIKLMNECNGKEEFNALVKVNYFIRKVWYNIREGLYKEKKPLLKNFMKINEINNKFFEEFEYLHQDYKILIEKHINNSESLILIDPPYINSIGNCFYNATSVDWEWLYDTLKIAKCKIIVIVNGDIFMRLLFRNLNFIEESYDKNYSVSKKNVKHYIFKNF